MTKKIWEIGFSVLCVLLLWPGARGQTDPDVLNFALNLECLEGEFYNYAVGNKGLSTADRAGGPQPIGGRAAALTDGTLAFGREIAQNEKLHVEGLRSALGPLAVPCPLINLTAFASAFNSAVSPNSFSPAFSPFTNDLSFLLATFLFEDVGVSAYQGAAPLLSSKTNLAAAAGNFATESYQAGAVRFNLFNLQNQAYQLSSGSSQTMNAVTSGLAALRAKLGGGSNQGPVNPDGSPEVVPANANGQTLPRTAAQIIQIVTGGSPSNKGLFFPNGLNGNIK